jgi:hypothetical protein
VKSFHCASLASPSAQSIPLIAKSLIYIMSFPVGIVRCAVSVMSFLRKAKAFVKSFLRRVIHV